MDFKIDPKIRDLIPPLTDEEFANLEREILDDGKINEPLVTYKGVLLDGHHRYKIARKHNIPYEVVEKDFDDWGEAIWWVVRHQKARRNLTKTQEALLVADAEELVSSIKAMALKKNQESAERARREKLEKRRSEGESLTFPMLGKSEDSTHQDPESQPIMSSQSATAPVNPQADVLIQVVHMPEPAVREQAL